MPAPKRRAGAAMSGMGNTRRISANVRTAWNKNFKPIKPGQVRTAGSRKR